MLGTRHSFLFLTVLLAVLVSSPEVGSAQANEAPVLNNPAQTWPGQNWDVPAMTNPPLQGSTTAPIINYWTGTQWPDYPGISNQIPACSGIDCLSLKERGELNELCKRTGAEWESFELCKKIAISLLGSQP